MRIRGALLFGFFFLLIVASLPFAPGCSDNPGGAGGMGGTGGIGGTHSCGTFDQACVMATDCCSNICTANHCAANPMVCTPAGSSCSSSPDCCSVSCVNGFCSGTQCTADNQPCSQDGACCGGKCAAPAGGGATTCAPLNAICRTNGNPCAMGSECCSNYCHGGFCTTSSFCVQTGDACSHDTECCTGICNLGGKTVGTCAAPPAGATNCSGVDGQTCNGCGDCCSRLCAPYAPTGVNVCQPAEGCRINGDLCRKDSDCCGASGTGLPGDGNVTCQKAQPTDPVGICRNPMSCNPEGNVCHYMNYMTCGNSSARNDCCAAVGNSGVCQLDAVGVPRCYGLGTSCRTAGQTCAYSGDCCNNVPCVPDSNGVLKCLAAAPDGGVTCSPSGGACSATADCCVGYTCITPAGSVQGTCGTPAGSDGGATTCSQFGQACSSTQLCCNNEPCSVTGSNPIMACPAGQMTGCTCFTVVP